jgi:hypothetical protein
MIDGRALSNEADEIISKLMDVLSVHVALVDLDDKRRHARMSSSSSSWFSHEVATETLAAASLTRAPNDDEVCVRVNRRWILHVIAHRARVTDDGWIVTHGRSLPLSAGQVALVKQAAERLKRFLPAASTLSDVPWPDGSSGGGSGGAELGIPVWWARKVRN